MKRTVTWAALVAVSLLAACSADGGGALPPGSRSPAVSKAVPIYSPTPAANIGLVGALVNDVGALACGLTLGITCHVLAGAGPQGEPAGTPGSALPGLHPTDLQSAYALPSSTAGSGQTVGIVVAYDDPDLESDLAVYRSTFGLPPCTSANGCFKKVTNLLTTLLGGNQGWGQEASLDVDVVSAVCPNCKIVVVEAPIDAPSALLAAAKTAVAHGATVVSNSYSIAEFSSEASSDASYAIGVPFVFGAGDNGYGAGWPAASSHVIAVGGTSLARDGSARGWSETVWAGSGGGCSSYIPKPSWQHDTGCANRTMNDIAAFADPNPGVAVYDSYLSQMPGWRTYGGTSISAPIIAGAIALAGNGKSTLLNAASLYANAGGFNDIAAGANGSCATYLCAAVAGYDAPSGNGSPNGVSAL